SKRRLQIPPYSSATPKFRQIDLAWPMCRYPFGSGGNRVATRPWCFPDATSSATMERMKSTPVTDAVVPCSSVMAEPLFLHIGHDDPKTGNSQHLRGAPDRRAAIAGERQRRVGAAAHDVIVRIAVGGARRIDGVLERPAVEEIADELPYVAVHVVQAE